MLWLLPSYGYNCRPENEIKMEYFNIAKTGFCPGLVHIYCNCSDIQWGIGLEDRMHTAEKYWEWLSHSLERLQAWFAACEALFLGVSNLFTGRDDHAGTVLSLELTLAGYSIHCMAPNTVFEYTSKDGVVTYYINKMVRMSLFLLEDSRISNTPMVPFLRVNT